jgi:opacity protein-like surface antigen
LAFVAFAANKGSIDMKKFASLLLIGSAFAAFSAPVLAADLPIEEPPVVIDTPPVVVESAGGWYLRGDAGYVVNGDLEGDYVTYGPPPGSNTIFGKLDNSFSGGVGVGYQLSKHLRADLTADYFSSADFTGSTRGGPCGIGGAVVANCISTDTDSYRALSIMANAYVDIGKFGRVTPYVGAGIGATHIKWSGLSNIECDEANPASCNPAVQHAGGVGWRATGALMAGASIDITCNLKADVGYRFRHIEGGRMFEFAGAGGPGDHGRLQTHEARAGLRWAIGGNGCGGGNYGGGKHHGGGDYDGGPVYK